MKIKISKVLLDYFVHEGLKTDDVEVLALIYGQKLDNGDIVAKTLIFPQQIGCNTSVEDLGKINLYFTHLNELLCLLLNQD